MREIKAIVRPDRLYDVVHALRQIEDMPGVTVSVVQGFGRRHPEHARDLEPTGETSFAKIETVVPAGLVDRVIDAIQQAARTGRSGDGKVFVIPVESVTRISAAEDGEQPV